ncbi:MAG: biotin--[acetyl-CoA-carboxylase] ligase [Chloroflexi bacterium]|nr:biotin--[acetyl-CoA-carboxylase] ligase [Chloroflexota bacterium]
MPNHPHTPYRTEMTPQGDTELSGVTIEFHESLSSTSDLAAMRLESMNTVAIVVVADSQSAGRGRFSRTWNSNAGDDLLVSIGLRPTAAVAAQLAMISAVAAADTVEQLTNQEATIKWPNDIRVRGKKISGILIESQVQSERFRTIVGIGLNLNLDPAAFPEIADLATSVRMVTGERVDRSEALGVLIENLDRAYTLVCRGGSVHSEWKSKLDTMGKAVEFTVQPSGELVRGIATDVTPEGLLLVQMDDGRLVELDAGEVTSQSLN